MIFLLVKALRESGWLDAHGLDFLRVFNFVTFQATVAVMTSFLICITTGPSVILSVCLTLRGCRTSVSPPPTAKS